MADVKISQLPAATTPLAGTEEVPLVQSGTTKKVSVTDLRGANPVTAVTGTAPVVSSGGTTPAISMAAASTSTNGYLTSTDWNTFNGKGSGTVTGVTATSPVVSSGGAAPVISMPAATTSANGYLTSTDWNTFNNKGAGTVTGVTATSPVFSSGGAAPVISMVAATTSADGYLTSTDWNTFNGKYSTGGALGTPSSGTATNLTGLPLTTGVIGLLPVANGGSGTATPSLVAGTNVSITGTWPNQTINSSGGGGGGMVYPGAGIPLSTGSAWDTSYSTTGTGNVVLSTSPTLVTPVLGTPTSATLTNATGLPLTTGVTGLLPVANGGSGTATPALVAGTNVTITGSWPNQTINSTASGSGTVTSVAATVPSFLSVTGSPITTSGTIAIDYSGTALPIANGGTGATSLAAAGIATLTGTETLTNKTISGADNTLTVDGTNAVGFRVIPQNSQSAAYTLVLDDSGKHIFHPSSDNNARTFTIPANSSVAFPIGTAVTFINMAVANVTIAITTDTLTLSPAGTTGSRTLARYGSATAIKITSTEWLISGSGLT